MTFAKLSAAVVLSAFGLAGPVGAQSAVPGPPAELPPASFDGTQYVDSRGCVYVRAGIDGAVAWVPRVTRARKPVCDAEPTVVEGRRPAVPQAPDGAVVRAAVPENGHVSRPKAARKGMKTYARGRVPVVAELRLSEPVPASALPGSTRVVPLHVMQERSRIGAFNVPSGYRAAWEDDRLNLRRAEGTLAGRDAMNRIWTTTVPRRLVDPFEERVSKPEKTVVYRYVQERRIAGSDPVVATRDQLAHEAAPKPRYGAEVGR